MTTVTHAPVIAPAFPPPTLDEALNYLACTNYKAKVWQPLRDIPTRRLEEYVQVGRESEPYAYAWSYVRLGQMAALVLQARGRVSP